MFLDGNGVPAALNFDLCIIGAGAAGITIAKEFANSGVSVALVESGSLEIDSEAQKLNEGETSESIPDSQYLTESRKRAFGGTTNIWAGWTHPFEEVDFESRSWVENSGWPIKRLELLPFYDQAAKICQVKNFRGEVSKNLFPGSSSLVVRQFHLSPPTRFGQVYRQELETSKNLTVLLNSNVTKLEIDKDKRSLKTAEVRTLSGAQYSIRAKAYVVACGGIENCRLLLSSDVGNSTEMVGKYFMEHPHLMVADTLHFSEADLRSFFRLDGKRAFLSPSRAFQEEKQILNFALVMHKAPEITAGEKTLNAKVRSHLVPSPSNLRKTRIELRVEQKPIAENRVTLSQKFDKFGKPLAKLNWKLNESEMLTAQEGLKVFANELGARSMGRVKFLQENFKKVGKESPDSETGLLALWHHHMGGTRMHNDPKNGVVDSNCKVHGVANLFIAGSSVFPTSSFANPTLTIVALALRLAGHLKDQLPRYSHNA